MLPEYAQARKAIWNAVNPHSGRKRIDEAFPHELRKTTRDQEMLIEFLNGSTWQVVGSDSFNSLVGSTPAGIVYSEWALANPESRAYLRPIIEENNGWQLFITTPRGRNHAHRTLEAARRTPGAFAQVLTAEETGIFSVEQLEQIKQSYVDDYGLEAGVAKFEQEYLCSFEAANLGAILARSIGLAEKDGRIGPHVSFDPHGAGIQISADIGRKDTATWWFWQPRVGGYALIDHASGFGLDADEWCDRLMDKLSKYRTAEGKPALEKIWLPHDARAKTFAAKHSTVEVFANRFGVGNVAITPSVSKSDRINAARRVIRRCEFSDACDKGLEALRSWSFEWDEDRKTFSNEPKHDWASHDGDGYSYGCVVMEMHKPVSPDPDPRWQAQGVPGGRIQTATLDELWATAPNKSDRI